MSISKELRDKSYRYIDQNSPMAEWLRSTADRIDAETVELPQGADGVPIHIGDTVFTNDDIETSWCVRYIELRRDREPSIGIESSGVNTYRPPSCLTHKRPDSLERIADDISKYICESGISGSHYCFMADVKDRLRALAKEGE